MTIFLRLLADRDKAYSLGTAARAVRSGKNATNIFEKEPTLFSKIPGAPFSYWASNQIISLFSPGMRFERGGRVARRTNGTTDDGRWIRAWWEVSRRSRIRNTEWIPHAKGGAFSPCYADLHLVIHWDKKRETYPGYVGTVHRPDLRPASLQFFFQPGLTWSRRNSTGLSFRPLPQGAISGDKGPGVFFKEFSSKEILATCAILNSIVFKYLVSLQLGTFELAQSYEAGLIQQTPFPNLASGIISRLSDLAGLMWRLKYERDGVNEISHAFTLPAALRRRFCGFAPQQIEVEIMRIQSEIDEIAFELYSFDDADRAAMFGAVEERDHREGLGEDSKNENDQTNEDDQEEEDEAGDPADVPAALLSWCVGLAFGRFDWRLATGERQAPPEPGPFDPLPARSPGMLPEGAQPFHDHAGILADDPGHPHDLARLIENVLGRVEVAGPADVRRWLRREFFPYHLQRYSKSRRKAPIYWPLSTASGDYTLWLYYPALTNQTLYAAANDFVGPKLEETSKAAQALRTRTDRSRDEERRLEQLQHQEAELKELRDELLRLAPSWKPNHDDGVQITAAPLWRLFRHKPWQKVLRETWAKLEGGDYDWAHLAMAYWPERVREKCRTDKSLAIAHGLEELYEPQAPDAAKV